MLHKYVTADRNHRYYGFGQIMTMIRDLTRTVTYDDNPEHNLYGEHWRTVTESPTLNNTQTWLWSDDYLATPQTVSGERVRTRSGIWEDY